MQGVRLLWRELGCHTKPLYGEYMQNIPFILYYFLISQTMIFTGSE